MGHDVHIGSRGVAEKAGQPSIRQTIRQYALTVDNPAALLLCFHQVHTTPHQPLMYTTYEDSVVDHADEHGNLSHADATKLLADHGFTWKDLYADNCATVHWGSVQACHAETLLAWLGY